MAQDIAIKIDNRYEVLGELGRGGMGVVYKATDLKMDRVVAIKVMTSHGSGRDEYQERFLREAKSIARMQHPNIVVVHDYGNHNGAPYMVMEYVEGIPLDKVIASRVSLTALAKIDYIIQVCHALHYAHEQDIVHRDVKPGNIMVLEGGKRIKLLDFGIARAGGVSNLSKSGLAMGTTCYMSPEQTKGQKDLDGRADIFSAGVVLYELLAGRPPWTGDGDYEVMTKIINDRFPPLSSFLRNYPPALDQVFELALAKNANDRYQTAEKMAHELAELETPLKEQVLEEAMVQFENGDLLRANDLVSQILRIDTRHREALDLQGKLQQVAQLQQRTEQVRQLRTTAEQAVGQKRYSDALAAVEQAISIDSANTELFHYRELIRHEVKRREDVRKKLELARRAQEINDLSTAQELVDKALEADPTDTQARMMKSSLEQEKKKQQQQEIAEDASRALAMRAFGRAREFIKQLEALDPRFPPLTSLRKALLEGEEEEQRSIEIDNFVRKIRQTLETGSLTDCLALTEQALARFPGETRLLRLRAQAETLRNKAEQERAIQEQIQIINKLTESGRNAEALVAAESAIKKLGADYRLQAVAVQLRHTVERDRQLRAEQAVLARARKATEAKDLELAVKILAQARVDFPNSKEIGNELQIAQAAITRKAEEARALDTSKRQITETLERSLAIEPDPELQIKLAEEAVRKVPGNDPAELVLRRVRERQQQIASAVERAHRFEQSRRYADAIREWERVKQLWPQYPQLSAQVARLTAASQPRPAPRTAEPAAKPPPSPSLSATSMMAAAPQRGPVSPPEAAAVPQKVPPPLPEIRVARAEQMLAASVERIPARPVPPIRPAPAGQGLVEPAPVSPYASGDAPPVAKSWWHSRKFLLVVAGAAAVAIVISAVVYLARGPKSSPLPTVAEPHPIAPITKPVPPLPKLGTLLIQTNVDQATVWVDGDPKATTEGGKATITMVPGNHSVSIKKQGYTSPAQQLDIVADSRMTRQFTLVEAKDLNEPPAEPYLIIKASPGATVWIDKNMGQVPPDGSYSTKITPGQHHVRVKLDGYEQWSDDIRAKAGDTLTRKVDLKLIPKPPPTIVAFFANSLNVQQGQSVTLQWETQNATDISIDQEIGIVRAKDSLTVTPKGPSTTYTMTAKSESGIKTGSVTINVTAPLKPVITRFVPGADTILAGKSVRLIWDTQNATAVSINPELGSVELHGDREVSPSKTTTYTLTATGPGGTITKSTQVNVDTAPVAKVEQPATPPPLPPPPAEDPEAKAARDTIQVRYKAALQHMSIDEVRKVWVLLPKPYESSLKDVFDKHKAVLVEFNCNLPKVNGNSAECSCSQTLSYTVGDKVQKPQTGRITFDLQKVGGSWFIAKSR